MFRQCLVMLTVLAMLVGAPTLWAASAPDPDSLPKGAMFRYHNAKGQLVLTSTLPTEAIYTGYDILDSQGQLIRSVAPAPTPEEQAKLRAQKQQQHAREEQAKKDEELQRLYAGPDDAIRARDRQVEALQLNIDYDNNNISQLKDKLNSEVSSAAKFEREGRKVPEMITDSIDQYTRQIKDQEADIAQRQQEIEKVKKDFAPTIERLKQIKAGKSGDSTPSASGANGNP